MYKRNHRQILAIGVDSLDEGSEFREWPLHITLVPWFEEAKQPQLSDGLETVAGYIRPFEAKLGARALFGAQQDVPVWTIEENRSLQSLHNHTLTVVYDANGQLDYSYVGYHYKPHITVRQNENIDPVQHISQMALVDDLGNGLRRVTEVFELYGR